MKIRRIAGALIGGSIGMAFMLKRRSMRDASQSVKALAGGMGAAVGMASGIVVDLLAQLPGRVATLESLMPKTQLTYSDDQVIKPTPAALFTNRGSGTDFETRLSSMDGYLTPVDRFYIRSHGPTPIIDVGSWRLAIHGTGVKTPVEFTYDQIAAMPQITVTRVIECAGNGRRFFKEFFGVEGEGGQWRTGAIGCAEWTGVRLRDILQRAGLKDGAGFVMPVGLDDHKVSRPMPLEKALRDDTLLVLKMNGEALLPDHGFPVRMLVSGWVGTASIKWVGSIQVAEEPLYSPYNTMEYIMVGPKYPMKYPALGPPITEMPITSVLDLDWPAKLGSDVKIIRGRSYAGEGRIKEVAYSVDNGAWENAELTSPNVSGSWVCWQFSWNALPGAHEIRVRATDERGATQPEEVPWNHHGYLYNAIVAHPVTILEAA